MSVGAHFILRTTKSIINTRLEESWNIFQHNTMLLLINASKNVHKSTSSMAYILIIAALSYWEQGINSLLTCPNATEIVFEDYSL